MKYCQISRWHLNMAGTTNLLIYASQTKMFSILTPNLFVEFIAGPQSVLDGVLVVRGMEVENIHAISLQPLKGGFQL